jgi:HD-GYP domain-containing protein (c-di-GMP phosphodiesterase class II)
LAITRQKSDRVRLSALLHDIGKIGMDQKILTKPGELTAEEFEILKTHPVRGVEMLRSVTEFADLPPGIELHHESMDGKGYPHGLCADEIPLMARIIAVADSFDAMTHDRTYQTAMEGGYALRIIRTLSGRKFDEKVVEAFCRVYASGEVVLPKRKEATKKQGVPAVPVPAPSVPELIAAAPKPAAETPSLARILSD